MRFVHPSPGSIVLYRASGSFFPLWPAVICTDDMAPKEVVRARPTGYVTLLLTLGDNLDFRWALTTEISNFDPFIPITHEDIVGNTPGLGAAYDMADNALEASLGLDYWRERVMSRISDAGYPESEATSSDGDAGSESEMRMALRLSQEEFYSKRSKEETAGSAKLPTPSISPHIPARDPSNQRIVIPADVGRSSNLFTSAWAGPPNAFASSSQLTRQHGKSCSPSSSPNWLQGRGPDMVIDLTDDSSCSRSAGKSPVESAPFRPSFFDRTLGGLDRGRKEPISDVVEGEIFQSKEFVQVPVGPNSEISTLQKESIWNRPYFRDPMQGINFFGHNDDGIWGLQHPALVDIDPEDFVFVAEYLESDGFGYRNPQDGNEMDEAFAQCVSAWFTAEKLGMSDMMDHVVEKLEKRIEPGMHDVLVFADQIYRSQDTALLSQAQLKDYCAMYIAENWWIYWGDDNLRSGFIERLRISPELEGDILRRRTQALEERVNDGQEDSETESD
ncbi:hypothetical protein ACET3X_000818 [Alternaria dauci]|uniref:Uncharacterized protein n=1 Tax=Alternaria dauci TaxID=48095 RepID=A0ABR3UVI7_9PLEO